MPPESGGGDRLRRGARAAERACAKSWCANKVKPRLPSRRWDRQDQRPWNPTSTECASAQGKNHGSRFARSAGRDPAGAALPAAARAGADRPVRPRTGEDQPIQVAAGQDWVGAPFRGENSEAPWLCRAPPKVWGGDKPDSVRPASPRAVMIISLAPCGAPRALADTLVRLIPGSCTRSRGPGQAAGLPVMSCTPWGFSCLAGCPSSGGLLPRLFTLTPSCRSGPGRSKFLRHFPSPRAWARDSRVFYAAWCLKVSGLSSSPACAGPAIICHPTRGSYGRERWAQGRIGAWGGN